MDDYLGQILDSLKEQKLDKKTIIVIQSEHGEGLGENGYYAHYDIFDTETRVPLLIVDPRNKEQKRVKSSVGSVDILPTVLEMTNNSVPSSIQGRSLLGIMNGDESDGKRDAAYIERVPLWEETSLELVQQVLGIRGIKNEKTGARDIAIRTEKWKYIKRLAKDRVEEISWWKAISGSPVTVPPEELYDLEADPLETKNVISEHPDVAAELRTRLDAWYAKVNSQRQPTKSTELIQPYQ
jgi:arylsulfatase A-like enzyme